MKVFAISDMHGNLEGLDPSGCDIVVIAGDFAMLKGFSKWRLKDQKEWIQKKFFSFSSKYPDIEFVIVPGNHDKSLDRSCTSAFTDINWNIEWPSNVHLLIDSSIEIKGLKIYGMPWVPIISYRWAFEAENEKLKAKCDAIPDNVDILITHTPPIICNSLIDRSIQNGAGTSFGSAELTNAIVSKKPRYVFCGHIHSGTHGGVLLEESMCYNVARVDENYEIGYEPTIVDISPIVLQ